MLGEVVRSGRRQHRNATGDGLEHSHAESFAIRKRNEHLGRLYQGVEFLRLTNIMMEFHRISYSEVSRSVGQCRSLRPVPDDTALNVVSAGMHEGHHIQKHVDPLVTYQAADKD